MLATKRRRPGLRSGTRGGHRWRKRDGVRHWCAPPLDCGTRLLRRQRRRYERPDNSTASRPRLITRTRLAQREKLTWIGRHDENCAALSGKSAEDLSHFRFGDHVDALGRLVQNEEAAAGEQPAREHHLLLVAAAQLGDQLLVVAMPDLQRVAELANTRAFRALVQPAQRPAKLLESGDRDVRADGEIRQDRLIDAIFGQDCRCPARWRRAGCRSMGVRPVSRPASRSSRAPRRRPPAATSVAPEPTRPVSTTISPAADFEVNGLSTSVVR